MQNMIDSQDGKIYKKRTPRGARVCLEVEEGIRPSSQPKPDNIPEWAVELFDND